MTRALPGVVFEWFWPTNHGKNNENNRIGTPLVDNALVIAEIIKHGRRKKIKQL